jgi:linearmycin/streptolysin S transport system ATP-binding protein
VFGSLYGVPAGRLAERVAWALDWTGLAERANGLVRGFSGGMKRRLNVACGVLHEPRVLLLDEPTVGVDPQSRERLYDMLAELRGRGTSLLLTTHQLEEAEARCERIVIIDHGRVVAAGTLAELVERTIGGGRQVVIRLDRGPATPVPGLEAASDGTLRGSVSDAGRDLPELIARVQQAGCHIEHLEVRPASLQTVFLHLTGKELRE